MTKKYRKSNKTFLSDRDDEFGTIAWMVGPYDYGTENERSGSAEVRLTDCYKVITLDFSYSHHKNYVKRIEKIDNLIEELESFKSALIESWGKR